MAPGRALDLGCGEGRNAVWLAQHGWQVTAVDFSDVAIERAAGLAVARGVEIDLLLADLNQYRPEPGAYDLVLVLYLHLPPTERAKVLAGAVEALAPGGTILVVGHDLENLERGYGGPPIPEILYTPESIASELAPLSIVKVSREVRMVQTDDGIREAIDTLVRAER
jgi:SAM-dependent methyltransferase